MDKIQTPQVIEDCRELLLWLIPLLDKFPRNRRFTLGERLETRLLVVFFSFPNSIWECSLEIQFPEREMEFRERIPKWNFGTRDEVRTRYKVTR